MSTTNVARPSLGAALRAEREKNKAAASPAYAAPVAAQGTGFSLGDEDVKSVMELEFIRPADLHGLDCSFRIVAASERDSRFDVKGQPGVKERECLYTIEILDGRFQGAQAVCSLNANEWRRKLMQLVRERGATNPLRLSQLPPSEAGQSPAWTFVDYSPAQTAFPLAGGSEDGATTPAAPAPETPAARARGGKTAQTVGAEKAPF